MIQPRSEEQRQKDIISKRKSYEKHRDEILLKSHLPWRRFNNAKSKAKTRNIEWSLSFAEWLGLISNHCY